SGRISCLSRKCAIRSPSASAHLRDKQDIRPLDAWMNWLVQVADAWQFIERSINSPELDLPVQRELFKLGCFKWQEWRPLVLFWTMAFQRNRQAKTAVRRFKFVHARCAAISVLELDADSRAYRFRKALTGAARGVVFSQDKRDDLPLNFQPRFRARIKERLLLPIENHEVRRALVLWHDLNLRTALPGDPANFWSRASIEHVLPRKPEPGSQWLVDFPDAETRYLAFASLGNLGVIDRRLQSKAANEDWEGDGGKQALFVAEGQHIKYNSMAGIGHVPRWTADVIRQRAEDAAEAIWERLLLAEPD
ncbi:MAG: HNH endonuclease family protein, partial [Pseudomonadota bacterium]